MMEQMTNDLINQIDQCSKSELIDAYKRFMSNRKLNDKASLAYQIGMLGNGWYSIYWNEYSRDQLIEKLFSMINEKTIMNVIKSDYTRKQILQYINH